MNLSLLTDDELKSFVIKIFNVYDKSGDGTL